MSHWYGCRVNEWSLLRFEFPHQFPIFNVLFLVFLPKFWLILRRSGINVEFHFYTIIWLLERKDSRRYVAFNLKKGRMFSSPQGQVIIKEWQMGEILRFGQPAQQAVIVKRLRQKGHPRLIYILVHHVELKVYLFEEALLFGSLLAMRIFEG